jgi:hypothetical protein
MGGKTRDREEQPVVVFTRTWWFSANRARRIPPSRSRVNGPRLRFRLRPPSSAPAEQIGGRVRLPVSFSLRRVARRRDRRILLIKRGKCSQAIRFDTEVAARLTPGPGQLAAVENSLAENGCDRGSIRRFRGNRGHRFLIAGIAVRFVKARASAPLGSCSHLRVATLRGSLLPPTGRASCLRAKHAPPRQPPAVTGDRDECLEHRAPIPAKALRCAG